MTIILPTSFRFVEDDKLRPLKDVIQDVIIQAIAFCDGNKTQAADELGIARSSLYRKVGAYKEYLSQKQEPTLDQSITDR